MADDPEITPFRQVRTDQGPAEFDAEERVPVSPLALEPLLRATIFEYVLNLNDRERLTLSDISTVPPIAQVCRQFAQDVREIYASFQLHVERVLDMAVDDRNLVSRKQMQGAFSAQISMLSVSVRVIQQVERRRPEELLKGILDLPGVHCANQLLVPEIDCEVVTSISSCTPSTLARVLAKKTHSPNAQNKYIASFAPAHHANIFSWLRFTGLGVDHLTIRLLGTSLWDNYYFAETTQDYRALPITAVIASIIAFKPYWVRKITLAGLGSFASLVKDMWERIPDQTPITGLDPLLDMLVAYPFPSSEDMGNVKEMCVDEDEKTMTKEREGNLFGLRSGMQWQAMIMKARHDRNQAEWRFLKKAWGEYEMEWMGSAGTSG